MGKYTDMANANKAGRLKREAEDKAKAARAKNYKAGDASKAAGIAVPGKKKVTKKTATKKPETGSLKGNAKKNLKKSLGIK